MEQALSAGVRFFQYRNKRGIRRDIYRTAKDLARIARQAEALFIVNDHADIAAAADADGVHLGQDDLPISEARKLLGKNKLIGISTHSSDEARSAASAGADYIGFGPIFMTTTKDAGQVQGVGNLAAIRSIIAIPIIAIGGITTANISETLSHGADGVAVISALLATPDIKVEAERMVRAISGTREG